MSTREKKHVLIKKICMLFNTTTLTKINLSPSSLESGSRRMVSSRPAWTKLVATYPKNKTQTKGTPLA
jgi:hypothetical protein